MVASSVWVWMGLRQAWMGVSGPVKCCSGIDKFGDKYDKLLEQDLVHLPHLSYYVKACHLATRQKAVLCFVVIW